MMGEIRKVGHGSQFLTFFSELVRVSLRFFLSPRQCWGCTRIDGTLMQREIEVLILKAYNVVYGVFSTTAPMSLKHPIKL